MQHSAAVLARQLRQPGVDIHDVAMVLVRTLIDRHNPQSFTEMIRKVPYIKGKMTAKIFDALSDAWDTQFVEDK